MTIWHHDTAELAVAKANAYHALFYRRHMRLGRGLLSALSGLCDFQGVLSHGLRRGLHSFAALRLVSRRPFGSRRLGRQSVDATTGAEARLCSGCFTRR